MVVAAMNYRLRTVHTATLRGVFMTALRAKTSAGPQPDAFIRCTDHSGLGAQAAPRRVRSSCMVASMPSTLLFMLRMVSVALMNLL